MLWSYEALQVKNKQLNRISKCLLAGLLCTFYQRTILLLIFEYQRFKIDYNYFQKYIIYQKYYETKNLNFINKT